MGVRLLSYVLDAMPQEATLGDRLVMFVLAEQARDSTRLCWPGTDTLTTRTGMSEGSIRRSVRRLITFGILERVASGTDRNGTTVYAHRGHRTTFRIVTGPEKADRADRLSTGAEDDERRSRETAIASQKADPGDRLRDEKGGPVGPERRSRETAKPGERRTRGTALPSEVHPVREPSSARAAPEHRAVVRSVLEERTGKSISDDYADAVVREVLDGRAPKSPERYLRAALERELRPERWLETPIPPRYERPA
ncbi:MULTISPECIES: helix-turn-helix domain-containing protein [unclassified Pseudonocardia]|uniref:helix-turn-helix domain-containing protein n=1 Tax=unclassified Pseudonocardia TaxID=2619320 RepID=UPI0001FFE2C8|nr:helix-turn-helix domain-containing protein [Pseudonocardia sp. Ae707_Ps1]OLM20853.1 hypothetical protein Ae707Ps1_5112 [Pseudonocardia sp. Ae707_Ps1]